MDKPWVYLDTSAFLKLSIKEKGSERVRKIAKENHILSSSMLSVESFSALARRRQAGDIGEAAFDHVLKRLKDGIAAVETIRVTEDVLDLAGEITLRTMARTMDAVHIASARLFQEGTGITTMFITADKKQHYAALGEGLRSVYIG
jgi:predicted nucleic acid-binding protein